MPSDRAGGSELTHVRAKQGYVIVYLTGRPYWLTQRTRDWLSAKGVASGSLHVADSNKQILPTNSSVGDFKTAYLKRLQSYGLVIESAYGNAKTDLYAYGNAGVDKSRTFIVGKYGGDDDTVGLGDDYLEHLDSARAEPDVEQGFNW